MQQVDIKDYTIEQLESLGYKTLKELEVLKYNLQVIEATIEQKRKEQDSDNSLNDKGIE